MKTILLILVVLSISNVSFTQSYFHSGLFNISGEAAFSYSNSEQEFLGSITEKEIKLAPAVSYFFIERLSISVEFSYNYFEKSFEEEQINTNIEMFLGFGPTIKYYLFNNYISPFIKVGYSYNIYNITDSYFNNRKSFPGFSAAIGVGLNYFITNSLALESSFDYVYSQKQIEINAENSSTFVDSDKKTVKLILGLLYFL